MAPSQNGAPSRTAAGELARDEAAVSDVSELAGSVSDATELASDAAVSLTSTKAPTTTEEARAVLAGEEEGVQVICVGVMRTGLRTLHKALRNLGFSNIYDQEDIVSSYELWDDVLRNRSPKETLPLIFNGAQVVMGMPTFCFWDHILELYPRAKVILTVRDEDEWWKSVRSAKNLMDRDLPGAPLRYGSAMRNVERFLMPSYHKFCEVLRFAWATTLGAHALEGEELNEAAARGSFRRHNSYVKSTLGRKKVSGRPQLLVYDVREGWGPLCEFLGRDEPQLEFPSVMHVPYFPGQVGAASLGRVEEEEEMDVQLLPNEDWQELEALLVPDSDFGVRMRQELRRGLLVLLVALSVMVGLVLAMGASQVVDIPVALVALIYLAFITVGWSTWAIVYGLVMRVPALVVMPMAMQSFLIASALHVCFGSYGVLKEMLVTQDRVPSYLLVVSVRLVTVLVGAAWLLVTEGKISFGAPLRAMVSFACAHEVSTWAGYEMLTYLTFPIQIMAKSCKMLPNMVMGRLLGKTRHDVGQYAQAVLALVCVLIMHLSDADARAEVRAVGDSQAHGRPAWIHAGPAMGIALLVLYFVSDSFTSKWQTALYKRHAELTQNQLMFGGNLIGLLLTSAMLACSGTDVAGALAEATKQPGVLSRVLALGLSGAMGQFSIYTAIRALGPTSFTWIMTARQLLSVFVSLVVFGHGITVTKVLCILIVFGIMSSRQLRRVMPRRLCGCKGRRSGLVANRGRLPGRAAASGIARLLGQGPDTPRQGGERKED